METTHNINNGRFFFQVRFHLGSGINGNPFIVEFLYIDIIVVRFHLGSGINGNVKINSKIG